MAVQGQLSDEDIGPFAHLPGKWINKGGITARSMKLLSFERQIQIGGL